MPTFLFNEIIFGPVKSRRLGISLGINLLPTDKKYCNFDCIYCECGWSDLERIDKQDLPSRRQTADALKDRLIEMVNTGKVPDVITFAGNGEPTMHPQFYEILTDTVNLRNEFCPTARIAVLCNSTLLHKKKVRDALSLADQSILKLDTVNEETFINLNKPAPGIKLSDIIERLIEFRGRAIIQTMFVKGIYQGNRIDNTTGQEVQGLIDAYKMIRPELIMIYTFQRDTAAGGLVKVSAKELEETGKRIENEGFVVEISA